MTHPQELPKTIGELIDKVERIREDLLHVQRQLEKMEIVETALSGDDPAIRATASQLKAWTGEDRGNQSPRVSGRNASSTSTR